MPSTLFPSMPVKVVLQMAGALLIAACAAAPPKPETPPPPETPVVAIAAPSLSSFVGTWQEGEPCKHNFSRMVLREGAGVVEGRWAFFSRGWGLSTGSLRASPDGPFLRLAMCEDAATWGTHPPRYAEVECPELEFWHGYRGIRIDTTTGDLLLAFPDGSESARMQRLEPSVVTPLQCPSTESEK